MPGFMSDSDGIAFASTQLMITVWSGSISTGTVSPNASTHRSAVSTVAGLLVHVLVQARRSR
jgi:hypothetical protein